MNIFELLIVIVVIFLSLYAIIDRICSCVEQCAVGKAYGKIASYCGIKEEKVEKEDE